MCAKWMLGISPTPSPLAIPTAYLPESVQAESARPHCVHDAGVVHHAHGDAALAGAQLQVGVRGGAAGWGGEGGVEG